MGRYLLVWRSYPNVAKGMANTQELHVALYRAVLNSLCAVSNSLCAVSSCVKFIVCCFEFIVCCVELCHCYLRRELTLNRMTTLRGHLSALQHNEAAASVYRPCWITKPTQISPISTASLLSYTPAAVKTRTWSRRCCMHLPTRTLALRRYNYIEAHLVSQRIE